MRLLLAGDIRAVHLKRYIEYFKGRGHTTASLSLEHDPHYPVDYQLNAPDIPAFIKYFNALPDFKKAVRDFHPDLINCHFVPNYGMLGVLSRFHPLAVSVWGSDILISAQKTVIHKFKAKKILRAADLVLTDAEMLTKACSRITANLKKIVTIPHGVENKYLELGKKRQIGADKKLKIISTRQLEPLYRVGDFIRALGKLPGIEKNEIAIIGQGSLLGKLRETAVRYGFEERIFRGQYPHDELLSKLLDSDIYVSCSESDSTSVSLLEAMACGCFPVVSDIEGNREWIQDGVNGLLFKVGDTTELNNKIERARSDFELRRTAVEYNFNMIAQRAVWENNMAAVEREFVELAGRE